jgi:hypothetical protein
MFGPVSEALKVRKFSSDEEVIGALQSKNLSSDGI